MEKPEEKKILTRISIQEDGNLVVTDLWEEVADLLFETKDKEFEKID